MQIGWGKGKHEPLWQGTELALAQPLALRSWLLTAGSLTRRVQARCCGRFHLEVLRHDWQRPQMNERRLLKMADPARALIREVALCCDGRPWIFARTVLPATTLRGRGRRLSRLGRKPLGELLFRDRSVSRGHWQFTRIESGHAMFARLRPSLPPRQEVWGRRSVFFYANEPLLVSEMFLPALAAADGGDE